ncbi:MAG: chemotaxis protein CheW, partial [Deltaproteobacteria bacterium]|nr:chemotaxis protein CheW [Deltaproteobacteria bacterium]
DSQIRFVLLVASDLDAPAMTRHVDSPNASVTAVPEENGDATPETPAAPVPAQPEPQADPICTPPVHQQDLSSLLVQAEPGPTTDGPAVNYEDSASSMVAEDPAPPESQPPPPGGGGRGQEEFASLKSVSDTVRVDIRKLNDLMNLVGELVMHRSAIGATVRALTADPVTARRGEELGKTYKDLSRKLKDLQSSVLELRLVPLRQILDKLSRVVRRLRRELEKDVLLELNGVDTELDKLMVEELVDPLVHLVRNSFDHGIEEAEARLAAGKPEQGRIVIDAFQRGNHVVIQVTDDGRGIDSEAVRAKAEKMGVIVSGMELTRKEILDLVFHPGLSTRTEVTGTSGRGVGMDVVRENIKEMGGIVTIDSDLGKGTVTSITLPVTLAIIQSLIVGSSDQFYAIPLNSVLETLLIDPNEIQSSEKQELLNLRGEPLALRRISDEFDLPRVENVEQVYVVVVGIGESRLGLIVDRLEGQQDTVLKPIQGPISEVRGISGATEISEHGAVLVLDVAAIVEDTLRRRDVG